MTDKPHGPNKKLPVPRVKNRASRPVNLGKSQRGLTDKQRRFAIEYVKDFQPQKAMLRVNPDCKYPAKEAYLLRRTPRVAEYIHELMLARDEDDHIDALWLKIELIRQYRVAAESASIGEKSRPAERGNALRALENIGRLAEIRAFRDQIGISNPDGTNIDLSGLSDTELELLERLLNKASGGDPEGGSGHIGDPEGMGAAES